MRFGIVLAAVLFSAGLAHTTAAEPPAKERKDPENKRGISPYMETVVKGEKAFVAHDTTGAMTAFQDAIKLDSDKLLAYLRLGEVQLAAGKLEDADAAWTTALTKRGTPDDNAKVLFCIADLRERQHKW